MAGNRITKLPGTASYVKFVEVKNVRYQSYTGNVKAMINNLKGRKTGAFELIIRDDTKLSQPPVRELKLLQANGKDVTVTLVNRSNQARSTLIL